jgi:hypothetical protein
MQLRRVADYGNTEMLHAALEEVSPLFHAYSSAILSSVS